MGRCEDGIDRVCVIPGKMTRKKSHWLVRGSYILITLGNYQDGKGWKLLDEILTNANYINCKNISTIIILCILS